MISKMAMINTVLLSQMSNKTINSLTKDEKARKALKEAMAGTEHIPKWWKKMSKEDQEKVKKNGLKILMGIVEGVTKRLKEENPIKEVVVSESQKAKDLELVKKAQKRGEEFRKKLLERIEKSRATVSTFRQYRDVVKRYPEKYSFSISGNIVKVIRRTEHKFLFDSDVSFEETVSKFDWNLPETV